ncbi:hypothetical protein [Collimonas humicola]|uniref:hypothetical protein n=1 Tax=Collimonas humicola TaxID=2825886 RepID=UPI001B8B7B06|nr:hypothetical protein [Collimonas humicola]
MTKKAGRKFSSPDILAGDTLVLGVPVDVWHKAFTGNFQNSLAHVKQTASEVASEHTQLGTSAISTKT